MTLEQFLDADLAKPRVSRSVRETRREQVLRYESAIWTVHGAHSVRSYRGQWSARRYSMSRATLAASLAGAIGVAAQKVEHTSWAAFDLDFRFGDEDEEKSALAKVKRRHRMRSEPTLRDGESAFDAAMDAQGREPSWAEARRIVLERELREIVAELVRVVPELVRESSPRGIHLVLLLDRDYAAGELADLMQRMAEALGLAREVECFPRAEAKSYALCRFPLSGPGRLLAEDLVSLRNARRAQDVETLANASKVTLETLRARVEALEAVASRATGQVALPHEESTPHRRTGEAPEQLHGAEYIARALQLMSCIGPGESWEAARRISFALVMAGLSEPEAMRAWERLLERPGHEARHCATRSGRDALLRSARSCVRHVMRGGLPARLREPRLRAAIDELLGVPVSDLVEKSAMVVSAAAARSARARIGWEARRARAWAARHDRAQGETPQCSEHRDRAEGYAEPRAGTSARTGKPASFPSSMRTGVSSESTSESTASPRSATRFEHESNPCSQRSRAQAESGRCESASAASSQWSRSRFVAASSARRRVSSRSESGAVGEGGGGVLGRMGRSVLDWAEGGEASRSHGEVLRSASQRGERGDVGSAHESPKEGGPSEQRSGEPLPTRAHARETLDQALIERRDRARCAAREAVLQ